MSIGGDLVFAHLISVDLTARWAFLGQWIAGISVLVGLGILASQIFDSQKMAARTVLIGATVPMFLSQMSTTQVDLIVGIPLAATILAWRWMESDQVGRSIALSAASIAVALSVKGTSLLLIAPWIFLIVVKLIRQRKWKFVLSAATLTFFLTLLLNFGYLFRMLTQRSGAVPEATDVFNAGTGFEILVANGVRNFASAIMLPIPAVASLVQNKTERLLAQLGISPDLPSATFGSTFELPVAWTEDHAAAPLHAILALAAVGLLLLRRHRIANRLLLVLAAVLASQFLLIALVIKWQPWINRFTFLIAVFSAPLICWLITQWPKILRLLCIALLALFGIAWIFLQPLRGLAGTSWIPAGITGTSSIPRYASPLQFSRFDQLFMYHPPSALAYGEAISFAKDLDPDVLVIEVQGEWWEFPIWFAWWELNQNSPIEHSVAFEPVSVEVLFCVGNCGDANSLDQKSFTPTGPGTNAVETGPTIKVSSLIAD